MQVTQFIAHRPWPLPRPPWVMTQVWHDLLFAHWRVPPACLRALVPARLELDLLEGQAWLGVVPFRMSGIRARGLPPLPWMSAFPELNLRTYVTLDGKPGVWFFCLEAANSIAVAVARALFHLPYFRARMACTRVGDDIEYESTRTQRAAAPAHFKARYGPRGPLFEARAGSIEHWLTERYCLYACDRRTRVWRCEIHHPPWRLQPAEAAIAIDSLPRAHALTLPDEQPLLHFARRQDVVVWAPERVSAV